MLASLRDIAPCPKFIKTQPKTENIIYLDVSISNRDLHQKKLVLSPSET